MKKILTTLTVLLILVSALQAQQYVNVNKDFTNEGMHFFTNEIYPLYQLKDDKKYFKIGEKEYRATNDVDVLLDSVKPYDKTAIKDLIVRIIKDTITHQDSIWIDLRLIKQNENDIVWIANNTVKIQQITDSITVIAYNDVDSAFRLIIPNALTMWYNKSELTEYVKPAPVGGGAKEIKSVNNLFQWLNANVPGGIYSIGGLLLLLAGGVTWWLCFKNKEQYEVVFKGRSLKKFAKKYGGIDELFRLNPNIIHYNEATWESLDSLEKNNELEKLQGQLIRVKKAPPADIFAGTQEGQITESLHQETPDEQKTEQLPQKTPQKVVLAKMSLETFAEKYGGLDKLHELNPEIPPQGEWDKMDQITKKQKRLTLKGKSFIVPAETDKKEEVVATQPDPAADIPTQLRNMQKTIIDEINKIKNAESQVEKEKLEKLIREKEGEISRLRSEKEKFETLTEEKETQINRLDSENKNLKMWYNSLSEKVFPVEFLRNYAETIYAYFDLCAEVERKAENYYEKEVHRNSSAAATIACLLQKFRNSVSGIPASEWRQIVKDIKDAGITANKQVIRILSQPPTDNEKQREFRKTLFREVIVRYSSNVLILAESFRNLARFGINGGETATEFKKYVDTIVSKAKTIDMEIKYVPLFEKFDSYSAKIESVNKSRSFPYNVISNLQRDDIAEIVSYGIKTEFEETKTQIIIE
jgi:hypothetical protein